MNDCHNANYCRCGDRLIHQSARKAHESSSVLGQWVHDTYPVQFDWMDIDGLIYKKSEGRLRLIEHKPIGSTLRGSQQRLLPILAKAFEHLVDAGQINSASVVQLTGNPPFDHATATLFKPDGTVTHSDLTRPQVDLLLTGQLLRVAKR